MELPTIRANGDARGPVATKPQTQWVNSNTQRAIAELGALLQARRKDRGLSLRQMAAVAATSLGTIMRIESGTNRRPEFLSLISVSNALELRPDELAAFFARFQIGHLQFRTGAASFVPGRGSIFHPRAIDAAGPSTWETEAAQAGRAALAAAFVHRREHELELGTSEVARRAKVSLPFVSRVEKARVRLPEFFPLVSVAEVLGFSLPDMVRIIGEGSREH